MGLSRPLDRVRAWIASQIQWMRIKRLIRKSETLTVVPLDGSTPFVFKRSQESGDRSNG